MTPDERKRDIVERLRYTDQDIDRGEYAKAKLTCWDAHLEIDRLRAALATAEAKLVKAREALTIPANVVEFLRGTGPLDDKWFGETEGNRNFWWRRYLPPPAAEKP